MRALGKGGAIPLARGIPAREPEGHAERDEVDLADLAALGVATRGARPEVPLQGALRERPEGKPGDGPSHVAPRIAGSQATHEHGIQRRA